MRLSIIYYPWRMVVQINILLKLRRIFLYLFIDFQI